MSDSKQGIVYLLSNPAMPEIIKIGFTTRDNLDDRLQELFTTSVPVPFECEYACKVNDCKSVEDALHIAFGPHRIHPKREFFKIEPDQAIAILELLKVADVTSNVTEEINKTTSLIDKEAGENLKRQRRPPLNFQEMGIPVGSKLVFLYNDDKTIESTVISEKKVEFNGNEYSLTRLTRELLGVEHDVQPTRYWSYLGRVLREYYDSTYQFVN
ncbi:hypothetical protein FACS1894137_09460 [Spirochaetia bacterium]|nr:hypothetical protein FACS1894137_09460 [Spirochaetia bacterium]